jgi:hypothetical protein
MEYAVPHEINLMGVKMGHGARRNAHSMFGFTNPILGGTKRVSIRFGPNMEAALHSVAGARKKKSPQTLTSRSIRRTQ